MNYGKRLRQLGYLWNLTESEASSLKFGDEDFQIAIKKLQNFMPIDFATFGVEHHNRLVVADGIIGPATEDLLNPLNRTCGLPDHPPPIGTSPSYDDPDTEAAVRTMQATGSGSWPAGCHQGGNHHIVKVHVDQSRFPSSWKSIWSRVITAVFETYRLRGILHILTDDINEANIRVKAQVLAGSTIGLAQFNNRSCNDDVFNKLDPGFQPSDLFNLIAQLFCHELGHNNNLNHVRQSRNNVMSPAITLSSDGFRGFVESDASYNTLNTYYGGEPVPIGPDPDPDPDPKEEEVILVYKAKKDEIIKITTFKNNGFIFN